MQGLSSEGIPCHTTVPCSYGWRETVPGPHCNGSQLLGRDVANTVDTVCTLLNSAAILLLNPPNRVHMVSFSLPRASCSFIVSVNCVLGDGLRC